MIQLEGSCQLSANLFIGDIRIGRISSLPDGGFEVYVDPFAVALANCIPVVETFKEIFDKAVERINWIAGSIADAVNSIDWAEIARKLGVKI